MNDLGEQLYITSVSPLLTFRPSVASGNMKVQMEYARRTGRLWVDVRLYGHTLIYPVSPYHPPIYITLYMYPIYTALLPYSLVLLDQLCSSPSVASITLQHMYAVHEIQRYIAPYSPIYSPYIHPYSPCIDIHSYLREDTVLVKTSIVGTIKSRLCGGSLSLTSELSS